MLHSGLSRVRSGVLALALVGAGLTLVAAVPVAPATPATARGAGAKATIRATVAAQLVHVFNATGKEQNWTVPAGVHQAHFDVRGAQGGGNRVFLLAYIPGGKGGRTVAEIRVIPGGVIHIFVGGKGGDGGTCPLSVGQSGGGFNGGTHGGGCFGGASGGGGGGGASDIRVGGMGLDNRVIIAGGGGGSSEKLNVPCGFSVGGGGGGLEGAHGVAAVKGCIGGTGGTKTSGGVQAGYPEGRGSLGSGEGASTGPSQPPAAAVAVATTAVAAVGSGPVAAAGAGSGRATRSSKPACTKAAGRSSSRSSNRASNIAGEAWGP